MKRKLVLFLSLLSIAVWSQPKVTTSIDTVKNKIGAEFKLSIKTNVDTLSKANFSGLWKYWNHTKSIPLRKATAMN